MFTINIQRIVEIHIKHGLIRMKEWSIDLHKKTWFYEQAVERWCNKLP
jgi:hypothetical protein